MSKIRLISMVAIGLFVIDLLLVGFILFNKPRPPHEEGPRKIIEERLHFDAQQITEFEKLIIVHHAKIKSVDSMIRLAKNDFFMCINTDNISMKDSLSKKLGQLQIEIEEIHYAHFIDIKHLCKPSQLGYYNDLLKEFSRIFSKEALGRPKH